MDRFIKPDTDLDTQHLKIALANLSIGLGWKTNPAVENAKSYLLDFSNSFAAAMTTFIYCRCVLRLFDSTDCSSFGKIVAS